ncbi:MAG: HpcH/HpaI aldolase/citrate lyase family protein [Parvibaculaceae bacterium]
MSQRSSFPQRVRARETVIGPWMSIPHPMVAEILAQAGPDFLLIDGEHAPIAPQTLPLLLPAAENQDLPTVYRVAWNRIDLIKAALDSGVDGLMVPMVNSKTEAEAAIAAAKYPPMGKRGMGAWRASNYFTDDGAYVERANRDTLMVLQIETKEAIRDIDAIAAVPGIDALFIGPADLSRSLGLASSAPQAELRKAYGQVVSATRKNGIAAGIDVVAPDYAPIYGEIGFTFMTFGVDSVFMIEAGKAGFETLRDTLKAG